VGKEASHLAWLIVQHADHDVEFQEKCLKLMKQKLKEKKIDPIEVAYLTDRVRVNKGKKQIYGTQFYLNKNGKLIPRPIYDKKNLDKRRKKLDLGILRNIEKN
jgi:translation initiation factor 6 (eIF-6)